MSQFEDLTIAPAPARLGAQKPLFGADGGLLAAALALWIVFGGLKLYLALTGNVIWEEAHFVVLGRHPDIGYPDVPAGWPLFGELCTRLFGWSPAAVRLPGLVIAQAIPFAIFFMAAPLVGRRRAILAGLLSMLVPALGVSGTIFYPEGALQLLLPLMLGGALRAMRGPGLGWWAFTGAMGGLGLFVHFRFGIAGLGVLLFALLTRDGRALWRRPGFWLAGAIAFCGLVPALAYNIREGWPSLQFHAVNRQVWAFNPAGLFLRFGEQVLLANPVFFAGMAAGAFGGWRAWRGGDACAGLLLWTGATLFLFYMALAPFYRVGLPHWPFLAYAPLIAWLPGALIGFVDAAPSWSIRRLRAGMIGLATLATGAAAVGAVAYYASWAHADTTPAAIRPYLRSQMEDWRRLRPALEAARMRAAERFGETPAIATAGHLGALRLEFPGPADGPVYALRDSFDDKSRFAILRARWGQDETALLRLPGRPVVLVLPEPTFLYHQADQMAFRQRICDAFVDLEPAGRSELPPGKLAVELYTGRVRQRDEAAGHCPLFPAVYLARPKRGERVKAADGGNFYGLAASPAGIAKVEILFDGAVVAEARRGLDPPGARAPARLAFDPDYPRVQFDFQLPRALAGAGPHRLSVRATTRAGEVLTGADRTIYLER